MYKPDFRVNEKTNVPILSKSDIEIIGENFIREFCPTTLKNPEAVDIETATFFMHLSPGINIM